MFLKPSGLSPEPLHCAQLNPSRLSARSPHHHTAKTLTQTENRSPVALMPSVPTVNLDSDEITAEMAACLADSFLGHVLFLKSQIPFPVLQLERIPGASTNSRSKKRVDLLNVMDLLSSHLQTTFTALSIALAQTHLSAKRFSGGRGSECTAELDSPADSRARAHMVFVVGPSIGAPKARVVLVLDGLELRPRDALEEDVENAKTIIRDSVDAESDDQADIRQSTTTVQDDEVDSDDDSASDATEPPVSRTPSPSPLSSSPSSPQYRHIPLATLQESGRKPLCPISQQSTPRSVASPRETRTDRQQTLRSAERLLSRTLADACAEEGGLSAELSSTQTHIFLQAPRRFKHPAWIPRQNYTRSLQGTLEAFMNEAICRPTENIATKSAQKTKVKTEGVWITCKARASGFATGVKSEETEPTNEGDEKIWWEWNGGKIVGFSDW